MMKEISYAILGYIVAGFVIYFLYRNKLRNEIPIIFLSFVFIASGFLTENLMLNLCYIQKKAGSIDKIISIPLLTTVFLTFLGNRFLKIYEFDKKKKEHLVLLQNVLKNNREDIEYLLKNINLVYFTISNNITRPLDRNINLVIKKLAFTKVYQNEVFKNIGEFENSTEIEILYFYQRVYVDIEVKLNELSQKIEKKSSHKFRTNKAQTQKVEDNHSEKEIKTINRIEIKKDLRKIYLDIFIFLLISNIVNYIVEVRLSKTNQKKVREELCQNYNDLIVNLFSNNKKYSKKRAFYIEENLFLVTEVDDFKTKITKINFLYEKIIKEYSYLVPNQMFFYEVTVSTLSPIKNILEKENNEIIDNILKVFRLSHYQVLMKIDILTNPSEKISRETTNSDLFDKFF